MNRRTFLASSIAAALTSRAAIAQQPTAYWSTGHEAGNLSDWSAAYGGGNYSDSSNGADLEVTATQAQKRSGNWSALCKIKRAANYQIGTRLMRWRDWNGNLIPREAFYSTWMYLPHNYVTTAGWWIVFQFKSQRRDNSASDPTITGNLWGNGSGYEFYFWDHLKLKSYDSPIRFQAGRWVHLEAWFKWDRKRGAVKFWQDGQLVIEKNRLTTKLRNDDNHQVWGVGNYTSDIDGPQGRGVAEVYFDDCAITSLRHGAV